MVQRISAKQIKIVKFEKKSELFNEVIEETFSKIRNNKTKACLCFDKFGRSEL